MGLVFVLNDKLPWVHEAVTSILSYAPGNHASSQKHKDAVTAYAKAIRNVWCQSFGEEHILHENSVKKKLEKLITEYFNKTTNKKLRETHSKRALIRIWRAENMRLLELFNQSCQVSKFDDHERIFYEGQKSANRTGYISEEIDLDYEEKVARKREENREEQEKLQASMQEEDNLLRDLFDEHTEMNNTSFTTRSGKIRTLTIDKESQTLPYEVSQPTIRSVNHKVCTEDVKTTLAKMSACGKVSVENSRKLFQCMAKEHYGHEYYLTVEEARASKSKQSPQQPDIIAIPTSDDPIPADANRNYILADANKSPNETSEVSTIEISFNETSAPDILNEYPVMSSTPRRRSRSSNRSSNSASTKRSSSLPCAPRKYRKACKDGSEDKTPITTEDYKDHEFVLPSARVIHRQKLNLAVQNELDAAMSLYDLPQGQKSTLHYDTTSRKYIDGEWVSLIIEVDGWDYQLRPLFMAYEDRDNIIRYIIETYKRLSVVISKARGEEISARELWNNTTAFMSDAVSKNLGVPNGISELLETAHIPKHLLCKSHTVEATDNAIMRVLSECEVACDLRPKIEAVNPRIKQFVRGDPCIAVSGVRSICSLISYGKASSPTNLVHEFNEILQEEGALKHLSLYQGRRFAEFGYLCASILDAFPHLLRLVDETHTNNLHVETVRIFLNCEFFLTELTVAAYFSHHVNFPLLNCVEKSDQSDLCRIFPKLYTDLCNGNVFTLSDFVVQHKHFQVAAVETDLEKIILKKMCTHTASVIKLQCGREYFPTNVQPSRGATVIHELTPQEQSGLPTNNLKPERSFSHFDRMAVSARQRNAKFRATDIRNNMSMLYRTSDIQLTKAAVKCVPELEARDRLWREQQNELKSINDQKKSNKAQQVQVYQRKVLQTVKAWGGPCTSVEELNQALQKDGVEEETCVVQELIYYRLTHPTICPQDRPLLKTRKVPQDVRYNNLCALLGNEEDQENGRLRAGSLPTNRDALRILINSENDDNDEPDATPANDAAVDLLNTLVAIIWIVSGKKTWYLGYVTEVNKDEDSIVVEHLERFGKGNKFWKFPQKDDICPADLVQVTSIKPDTEWDYTNARSHKLHLKNDREIALEVNNTEIQTLNQ